MTVRARNPETGEIIEVSEEMWEQVYSQQGYSNVDSAGEKSLHTLTREELNAKATELGIEQPESFGTKADLISAIEANQK